jgi:hypothetical protein
MNQIPTEHIVMRSAHRVKEAGGPLVLRAVCSGMDTQKMAEVQGRPASKGRHGRARVVKTHIADAPSALQHLLGEDFERGVIALRTRLESEYAEIKRDRDELANQNEELLALLESLSLTLDNAEIEATEYAMRIARIKNEIAAERARAKAGQRMRAAAGVDES